MTCARRSLEKLRKWRLQFVDVPWEGDRPSAPQRIFDRPAKRPRVDLLAPFVEKSTMFLGLVSEQWIIFLSHSKNACCDASLLPI